jgi:hypothetical protein
MCMSVTIECMQYGCTPLWVASANGRDEIVPLLLKVPGINVDAPGKVIAWALDCFIRLTFKMCKYWHKALGFHKACFQDVQVWIVCGAVCVSDERAV